MYNIHSVSLGASTLMDIPGEKGYAIAYIHRNKRGGDGNPSRNYSIRFYRDDLNRCARRVLRIKRMLSALMKQVAGV